MSLTDLFASRLSRPAGRVLDAPIRDIVHEVLKEHGYASPAEVQALRDEVRDMRGRVDGMEKRLADLQHLAEQARAEANLARQARASEAPVPAAAPSTPAPAPLSAAPRGGCQVPGCNETVRSKGFCSAHYQQWRRGTLAGFPHES